jgi:Kef-type K+ transport system membrane component KefB
MSSSERAPGVQWRAGAEAALVFSLILIYIWWLRFRLPYSWILILGLVITSHVIRGETLGRLGFRWVRNGSARLALAVATIAMALVAIGLIFHTIRDVSWQGAVSSLVLYCLWGLFQQYVLNGYFVNRFSEFLPRRPQAVAALAGLCFSLAHTPNWFLMAIALAGGTLCAKIYLKYRNLYFLGMAHGVVGFLIYLVAPDSISHHLYVGPKWFSVG